MTITEFLMVLGGVLLRLGLPLALTMLGVWLLRRLDARWQTEAEQRHGLAPVLAAGTRCWDVHHCPPERRAACRAYLHPETPCWQHFRAANGDLRHSCLLCEVFRDAPVPANGRA